MGEARAGEFGKPAESPDGSVLVPPLDLLQIRNAQFVCIAVCVHTCERMKLNVVTVLGRALNLCNYAQPRVYTRANAKTLRILGQLFPPLVVQ